MGLRAFWILSLGWEEGRHVQARYLEVDRPVWAPVSPERKRGDMLLKHDANFEIKHFYKFILYSIYLKKSTQSRSTCTGIFFRFF